MAELTTQIEAARSQISALTARLETAQSNLVWTQDHLKTVQTDYAAARELAAQTQCCGTFSMWSRPLTLYPGKFTVGGVPDTFTMQLRFNATAPVRARIMTVDQFARLLTGLPYVVTSEWPPTTSLDVTFHEAEGCASYVFVLDAQQTTVITPDVSITRAPASEPTGDCR